MPSKGTSLGWQREFMKVGRGSSETKAAENLYFFWQEINIEKRKKEARNVAP